jgi:2-polyprenyl-3-methyl-5-hydroxy-6-metoxy-1,4-benzoquinol methylase
MGDRMDNRTAHAPSDRSCPACDGHGRPLGHKNGIEMLLCSRCRSLYTAGIPQTAAAADYDGIYKTADTTVISDFIRNRVREIVSNFSHYRHSNHLLDLGFGSAAFMQAAAAEGWNVTGIEVSRTAVENARRLGFQDVFHGDLAKAGYPTGHFDVVVASEVLEHIADAKLFLKEVARVLRFGGLLWASTPHGRGLSFRLLQLQWSVVYPPFHLQLFSVRGARTLLKDAGFQRIHLATHGFNPYEVLHARRLCSHSPDTGTATDATIRLQNLDRVNTSRQLNEAFMRTPVRRACKQLLNSMLSATRLGDRLKIHAVR